MSPDETIATRASLLDRLKDRGDQVSWQEFFDVYWRLIYGVAIKAGLKDPEAQDVVQETIISVAKNVGAFRYDPKVCSFKTWMLRLTRWRILDRFRQREREAAGLGERIHLGQGGPLAAEVDAADRTGTLESLPDPAGIDLEKIWDEEWKQTTLEAAIQTIRRRISPEKFQVFHLYAVQKMPVKKVARMAGVSVAKVYLTRYRVWALIRKEVNNPEPRMPGPGADRPRP